MPIHDGPSLPASSLRSQKESIPHQFPPDIVSLAQKYTAQKYASKSIAVHVHVLFLAKKSRRCIPLLFLLAKPGNPSPPILSYSIVLLDACAIPQYNFLRENSGKNPFTVHCSTHKPGVASIHLRGRPRELQQGVEATGGFAQGLRRPRSPHCCRLHQRIPRRSSVLV